MKAQKRRVDLVSIEFATSRNQMHVDSMIEAVENFKKKKHGVNGECKYCSYIKTTRIGGSAMTESECGLCEKMMVFSSTVVDRLCRDCAERNLLCKHCGGDIDMKIRRKKRPFQESTQ